MDADMLARARAVVARIGDTAAMARDFGAVFTVEGPSALALIRLAEAVGRLAECGTEDVPWWGIADGGDWPYWRECRFCKITSSRHYPSNIPHLYDCTAPAIDAALAELAALDGGEVG